MGYADGYPRSLSNKGIVYLNKYKYPVVGRICMDQCMVSIGPKGKAYVGDEVELWGEKLSYKMFLKEVTFYVGSA